jgi:hypothetical protein
MAGLTIGEAAGALAGEAAVPELGAVPAGLAVAELVGLPAGAEPQAASSSSGAVRIAQACMAVRREIRVG